MGRMSSNDASGAFETVTKSLRKKSEVTPGIASSAFERGVVACSGRDTMREPEQNGPSAVTFIAFGFGVGSKRRRPTLR